MIWTNFRLHKQGAKKVVSNNPRLVDFATGLVISILNLPYGQMRFWRGGGGMLKGWGKLFLVFTIICATSELQLTVGQCLTKSFPKSVRHDNQTDQIRKTMILWPIMKIYIVIVKVVGQTNISLTTRFMVCPTKMVTWSGFLTRKRTCGGEFVKFNSPMLLHIFTDDYLLLNY